MSEQWIQSLLSTWSKLSVAPKIKWIGCKLGSLKQFEVWGKIGFWPKKCQKSENLPNIKKIIKKWRFFHKYDTNSIKFIKSFISRIKNPKLGLENLQYAFLDFLSFVASKCDHALKCAFFQKMHHFSPKMWIYFFKKGAFKDGIWYKLYKGQKSMFTSYYSRAKSFAWIFLFLRAKCAFLYSHNHQNVQNCT